MGVPLTFYCFVKQSHADVVKLVYTPDLGSGALRRGGSSPLIRTTTKTSINLFLKTYCIILILNMYLGFHYG